MRTSGGSSAPPTADRSASSVGSGSPRSPSHIAALDGVRGLAILAVIVFHALYAFEPANPFERLLDPVFEAGWTGVDLFFVLSGFLITGILVRAKGRGGYYRNFLVRRALRILPLYVAFVALTIWVAPAIGLVTPGEGRQMQENQGWVWTFLTNLLLAVHGPNAGIELNHLWSVAVEEQFYLVWPWVVAMLATRNLQRLCLAIAITAPAIRLACAMAGMPPTTIYWTTPLRLDALALGSLAAIMVRERGAERTAAALRPAAIAACAVVLAIFVRQAGFNYLYRAVYTLGYSSLALASVWLVAAAAAPRPAAPIRILFANGFMRMLGKYSFSLYLFHQLVMRGLREAGIELSSFPNVAGTNLPGALAYTAVVLAASLLIAVATWHVIEHPALAWKERLAPAVPATPVVGDRSAS